MKLLRLLFFAAVNTLLYCAFCRQVKIFRMVVGYFPNIALPRKFHEKMLWRKIFDHNPLFVTFCDKLATKNYVRHKLPDIAMPETLWSGRHLGTAPEELFQRGVVIKANHGSSFNYFTDTQGYDPASVNALAEGWLTVTYGQRLLEWGYRGARKLLLVEQCLKAHSRGELMDILIRCADGKALSVYVVTEHKSQRQRMGTFYGDGSPLVFEHDIESVEYGPLPTDFRLPGTFSEAVRQAEKLSQGSGLRPLRFPDRWRDPVRRRDHGLPFGGPHKGLARRQARARHHREPPLGPAEKLVPRHDTVRRARALRPGAAPGAGQGHARPARAGAGMKLLRHLFFAAVNTLLYCAFCRQVEHFRRFVGYFPNIAVPRKYHEKMFWRKVFDRNPLFVTFCDKLATKEYIRGRVPELRVPQTLWVGKDLRQAPRELFACGAMLKANHASSRNLFTDAADFDPDRAWAVARGWLRETYGIYHHEQAYFAVPKLLLLEELIPVQGAPLLDIKLRCVDGKAVSIGVFVDHQTPDQKFGTFTLDGSPLRLGHDSYSGRYAPLPTDFQLPGICSQIVGFAERLSRGVDYCRCDFLYNGRDLYAGEITVYPTAGMTRAAPKGQDGIDDLSNPYWDLRKSWFLSTPQHGWRGLYARLLGRELEGGRA